MLARIRNLILILGSGYADEVINSAGSPTDTDQQQDESQKQNTNSQ